MILKEIFETASVLGIGPFALITSLLFVLVCGLCVVFTAITLWKREKDKVAHDKQDGEERKNLMTLFRKVEMDLENFEKRADEESKYRVSSQNSLDRIKQELHDFKHLFGKDSLKVQFLEDKVKDLSGKISELQKAMGGMSHKLVKVQTVMELQRIKEEEDDSDD